VFKGSAKTALPLFFSGLVSVDSGLALQVYTGRGLTGADSFGQLCCEFGNAVSFNSFSSKGNQGNYDSPSHYSGSFPICLISLILGSFLILHLPNIPSGPDF
jgi:hypothetical protein